MQRIYGPLDQLCGTILWESKRTKLREDQRRAKADMALIISNALPKGVHSFDHVDGIWVTEPRRTIPVAQGQPTKMGSTSI